MPQRPDVHVPDGDIAYDHQNGAQVFTETQEHRDREIRVQVDGEEIGRMIARATPEDEDRFRALMETDMRQQAEINEIRTNQRDDHAWIGDLATRVLELEFPPKREGYVFKVDQELLWAVGTTVSLVVLQALADVENVTDWKAWAIGVGGAAVRAVLGLLLSRGNVTTSMTEKV